MTISVKRVYQAPATEDGFRVLVDRLWPRGLAKEKARVDLWMRDISPSTELRRWFGHEPEKWDEFVARYREELREHKGLLSRLHELERQIGTVTLLFAARDELHNEALVVAEVLSERP